MAYDLSYTGSTDDDQKYVVWLLQIFWQARTRRINFEPQWEEAAAICWPEYRNSFAFGHVRPPGVKYTEFQIDSAGAIAAHRFAVLCDALLVEGNLDHHLVTGSGRGLGPARGEAEGKETEQEQTREGFHGATG